jgi:hypothetical protein
MGAPQAAVIKLILAILVQYIYASQLVGLSVSTSFSKASIVMLYKRIFPPTAKTAAP